MIHRASGLSIGGWTNGSVAVGTVQADHGCGHQAMHVEAVVPSPCAVHLRAPAAENPLEQSDSETRRWEHAYPDIPAYTERLVPAI